MKSEFARHGRKKAKHPQGLLWSILQGRPIYGLKFRREHTIEPWIVDFA